MPSDNRNPIRNMQREIEKNPLTGLVWAHPGGIEAMEAQGARQLASQRERLPTEGLAKKHEIWIDDKVAHPNGEKTIAETLGIQVGAVVEGDPLFTEVTLPEGWKIERTGHSMWTRLVDGKGCDRAQIFFKAAFYDRRAHIDWCGRFGINSQWSDGKGFTDRFPKNPTAERFVVRDNGQPTSFIDSGETVMLGAVLFVGEPIAKVLGDGTPAAWKAFDAAQTAGRKAAAAWLDAHFPNWRDPAAHWDAPNPAVVL